VADVEKYPQFLPLCEALTVRSRKERDGRTILVADMTVGYKAIRETFTSQVLLKPDENVIDVKYLDGPFKYLTNIWRFEPATWLRRANSSSTTNSRAASWRAVMGAMFDRAFRMFSDAFEKRADADLRRMAQLDQLSLSVQAHFQRRPNRLPANVVAALIVELPFLGNRRFAPHR
jgi:coenzyme Q-binding protein COQ10